MHKLFGLLLLLLVWPLSGCGYDAREAFGDTPLAQFVIAAEKGDMEKLNALLRQGVDPDGMGEQDVTPLLWAAGMGDRHAFLALLKVGADPNFMFDGKSVPTMHLMARHIDPWFLKTALEYGGNPNLLYERYGRTPILECLIDDFKEDREQLDLLLAAGASIHHRDKAGRDVAMAAADLGQYETVLYLLKKGAKFDTVDYYDRTLLTTLKNANTDSRGQQEIDLIVEFLEAKGVDWDNVETKRSQ